jgi:two-component system, cell cycle sensor histidine kinase and response regulator CckA
MEMDQLEALRDQLNRLNAENAALQECLRQKASCIDYLGILEKTSEGICVDRDGLIQYMNPALQRIVGYRPEDWPVAYPPFQIFIHPDERSKVMGQYDRFRCGEETEQHFETSFIHKDGHRVEVELKICRMENDGEKREIISVIHDITERKRAEEKLEEERAFLRQVIDAVPSFISVKDAEGRFELANKSLAKAWGTTVEHLIGSTIVDLNGTEDETLRFEEGDIGVIRDKKEKFIPEEKVAFADPSVQWLSTYKVPLINREGICNRVLSVGTDVTYLKEAEDEKKALQKRLIAIQKMEAVGTLAGGIAHDFNNILMGIQGSISLLLYDLKSDHPHRQKLENIENYIQRGADLTKKLLGFARGGKYDVKPTNINELLGNTADLFGRTRKEVGIYRSFENNLWTVDVDRGQVEQVFLNLFINSSEAMPGGGNLDLETENVVFGRTDLKPVGVTEGRYVKITVTDQGIGMDDKTMERIFDPFFTTKPKGAGTGLGLASAYGIIKNHGGSIHVSSKQGTGTTFAIYLPVIEKPPVIHDNREEEGIKGRETILIVDDEQSNITVMAEMLEMLRYRVLAAGSGQEAVAIYSEKSKEIDLVILDMIMPGINGGRTFDILREINPDVAVILASGYSVEGEARSIINRGCRGFIQKPFHMQELSRKIRDVLDGKSPYDGSEKKG